MVNTSLPAITVLIEQGLLYCNLTSNPIQVSASTLFHGCSRIWLMTLSQSVPHTWPAIGNHHCLPTSFFSRHWKEVGEHQRLGSKTWTKAYPCLITCTDHLLLVWLPLSGSAASLLHWFLGTYPGETVGLINTRLLWAESEMARLLL